MTCIVPDGVRSLPDPPNLFGLPLVSTVTCGDNVVWGHSETLQGNVMTPHGSRSSPSISPSLSDQWTVIRLITRVCCRIRQPDGMNTGPLGQWLDSTRWTDRQEPKGNRRAWTKGTNPPYPTKKTTGPQHLQTRWPKKTVRCWAG